MAIEAGGDELGVGRVGGRGKEYACWWFIWMGSGGWAGGWGRSGRRGAWWGWGIVSAGDVRDDADVGEGIGCVAHYYEEG